jgi:hypothetical protein
MTTAPAIENAILQAIDSINAMHGEELLQRSLDEWFIAEESPLDSVNVLTLTINLEQFVKDAGSRIDLLSALADEKNKEQFQKFSGVAAYIAARV